MTESKSLFDAVRRNLPDIVFFVVCAVFLTAEFLVAALWD